MKLATLFAAFALLLYSLAAATAAGPLQSGVAPEAVCAAPAPAAAACSARVTKASWEERLGIIPRDPGTVVYDRCPPNSDKFCPAGTSCCKNAAGEYRCCK